MAAIFGNGGHIENNWTISIIVHNFKITFYVHITVSVHHIIWLSAVIFKLNDNILG